MISVSTFDEAEHQKIKDPIRSLPLKSHCKFQKDTVQLTIDTSKNAHVHIFLVHSHFSLYKLESLVTMGFADVLTDAGLTSKIPALCLPDSSPTMARGALADNLKRSIVG